MTPSPQEPETRYETPNSNGDRVVISGMSGVFPKASNIEEFSENLYNKVDPISSEHRRWDFKHPELSQYIGMVPEINRFDSQFFKISHSFGDWLDVLCRKLLEQSYQAIYDAGLSPEHLRGRNVGVFIGACVTDMANACIYYDTKIGYGILGCSKTMNPNRISYWLDVKGPSYLIDQGGSSSIAALEAATHAIERGECEAAIVGAGNLCFHPQTMIHIARAMSLSPDGKTKSFDVNADGCVRSEAINVLFIQKAKDALRIYADVVHVKTGFMPIEEKENGPKLGFHTDARLLASSLKEFYKEANISPNSVEYLEAYGSGICDVDKMELDAAEEVFCANRNDPLIIGSVMSNIGNTEAASGISSVTKVLIGYHKGKIAANLNYKNTRQDVPALKDGRMIIAADHQPIHRSYAAINNLSYNGINAHVLLQGHFIPKSLDRYKSALPRLITISGRHENGVTRILDDLKRRPIDPEQLALLYNIHEKRIQGHLARGYTILDTNSEGQTVSLSKKVKRYDDVERPVWFVYSGMGSQWIQMGLNLMRIPTYAASIERCHNALIPRGVDLIHILTTDDINVFDNILHAFVGITAIQIGLTDVMKEFGIVPDKIIGHSLGEVACAYADGCFTAEEAILASYARGRVSVDIQVIKGSMAAVGLGYHQVKNMCPDDIFVACHNGPESSTLSGPCESVKKIVATLTSQGIFAKEVQSGGIPYHSKYIENFRKPFLKILREIIKNPKPRSERWLSTSVPQDRWHEEIAKYSSAEYHDNNMSNAVLFEEILKLVPPNAVLIEIAPDGLLQAILKRSLPSNCINVPLTRRRHEDSTLFFLNAIGGLFMEGVNPQISRLYPKVEFPVSTETTSLSHLIEWIHDQPWRMPLYVAGEKRKSPATKHHITLHDEEFEYLRGNVIRGRVLYPFAAALVATWETLTKSLDLKEKCSVHFQDVHFYAQPILHEQKELILNVRLHRGNGKFEVTDESSKVLTGYITANLKDILLPNIKLESTELSLDSNDFYELLQERNYSYRDEFRTIFKANCSLTEAQLLWNDNWVTLIDGIFQLNNFRVSHSTVCQPTFARRICIDVDNHINKIKTFEDKKIVTALINDVHDITKCGGITVETIKYHKLPPLLEDSVILKTRKLLPNAQSGKIDNISDGDLLLWEGKSAVRTRVVLKSTHVGKLESLQWVETSQPSEPGITVDVCFAGLNDCDAKRAMGAIPFKKDQDFVYGMDFSGTTESGAAVMGLISHGAMSSKVVAYPELLWKVPSGWSLQDAATIPLAYSMAFYCLKIKATITEGMNILIMGGAGALGQAVISIALAHNCKIFTTVSDDAKKELLLNLFPELDENNIYYSRDPLLTKMVCRRTEGRGCDIIISCAVGGLKNDLLGCGAYCGITIDLVQIHSTDRFAFGFRHLMKQRSYLALDFSSIFDYKEDMKIIQELVADGIEKGYVRPLTYSTYAAKDVAAAFKFADSTYRNGRVIISLGDAIPEAESRFTPSPNEWQVVFCNDVSGIQFTEKLINCGARKLYLNYPNQTGHLRFKIRSWAKLGVEIELSTKDLSKTESIESILQNTGRKGYVEGLFIFITNPITKQLETSILKLDTLSRELCPHLKNFVVATPTVPLGNNIYLNRIKDQLPVTVVHLTPFQEDETKPTYGSISRRAAIDAILRSLIVPTANVFIYPKENKRTSLLQELLYISGLELPKNVSFDTTLQDIGVPDIHLPAIKAYLRDSYNTYIEENEITSITVGKIEDIEKGSNWYGLDDLKGLDIFFSYIESEEVLANTTLMVMDTRAKYWRKHEIDVNTTSLFIIPGLDGHRHRFERMCRGLKLPAITLQPGYTKPRQSIQYMAHKHAEFLTKKMKIKDNFFLLGYESGILLALETAKILEVNGLKGTVFCVGQTPEELKNTLEDIITKLDENGTGLEEAVLKHMVNLIKDNAFDKIESDVRTANTWEDKLEICVEELIGHNGHSSQYLRTIINAAFERITQVRTQKVNKFELTSRIVWIHSGTRDPIYMQSFSKQPVQVYKIDAPLGLLAQDVRCTTIINQNLSKDVLELFEKDDACETYLKNGDVFLHVSSPQ